MCSTAEIIILDEPANGLDPDVALQVYEAVHKLNKEGKRTIIMISHDIIRSLGYANRALKIEKGQIVFNDKPSKYNLSTGGKQ